ncbi:MAG: hypothetical protein DMG38_25060 [Acidobacteria bacterium]|nr:MAG: hypothetical protein DMG38_25060 [Acidobacteriota bacterium]
MLQKRFSDVRAVIGKQSDSQILVKQPLGSRRNEHTSVNFAEPFPEQTLCNAPLLRVGIFAKRHAVLVVLDRPEATFLQLPVRGSIFLLVYGTSAGVSFTLSRFLRLGSCAHCSDLPLQLRVPRILQHSRWGRFFRNKGFFYERRNREWKQRSRELRSVGIKYGTSIKWLTQLIASFYWSKPRLGPAVAKNVADLFEGERYERIREAPVELAFQLYLLDVALWEGRSKLAGDKLYIRNLKSYEYFALFSLVVRGLTEVGAKWGDPDLSAQLHGQWPEYYPTHFNKWRKLTKACIDQILVAFKRESRSYSRREGQELTYANYFKNQSSVARMLKANLTGDIRRCSRIALQS